MPPISAKHRYSVYIALNAAFALLVGIACAVGGFPDPRVLHLILLFALCSSVAIDIDSLNGSHALLGLFMLVYFDTWSTASGFRP